MLRRLWMLVFAAALLGAAPALAGDPACIWNALPQAVRDKVLAHSATDPRLTSDLNQYASEEQLAAAISHCVPDPAKHLAAAKALAGYMYVRTSGLWLETNRHLDEQRLARAWAGIDAPLRDRLIARAASLEKGPLDEELLVQFARGAGLPPEDMARLKTGDTVGLAMLLNLLGRAILAATDADY